MKLKFKFGLIESHVVMNLHDIFEEDKKIIERLLKRKSALRGGGGIYDSLTEVSAARIFKNTNLIGEEAILGIWKLKNIKSGEYFYEFTPFSGMLKIIRLEEGDEDFVFLPFDNYKKL